MENNLQLITSYQGIELGLNNQNAWCVKKGTFILDLSKKDNLDNILWLPLLVGEYEEFFTILKNSLELKFDNLTSENLIKRFPVLNLVITALLSDSIYWVNLGLSWAEKIHNHDNLFIEALNKVWLNKKYSQKNRHRAMKIINRERV